MGSPAEKGGTPDRSDAPPEEDNTSHPTAPIRLREALTQTLPDAMPEAFNHALLRWAHEHRTEFMVGGDDGFKRFNFEVLDIHNRFDIRAFHAVVGKFASASLGKLAIDPFDLGPIECHLTLYHHSSFFDFHDDMPGMASRRVAFGYYFHTMPRMFKGGQLQFMDGTSFEPENNTLRLFNPMQVHRVASVECMSPDPMHGRFALIGWIHERIPEDSICKADGKD